MNFKQYLNSFYFKSEVFLFALFATAFLLLSFFNTPDFSLVYFDKIVFSEATLNQFNVDSRVSFFYNLIFAASFLIPLSYLVFFKIFSFASLNLNQRNAISILSFLGLFTIVSTVIGLNAKSLTNLLLIACFVNIVLAFALKSKSNLFWFFQNKLNTEFVFAGSFQILFAIMFLFNSKAVIFNNIELIYVLSFILLTIIVLSLKIILKLKDEKIHFLLLSLVAIPFLAFISTEFLLFVKLNSDVFVRYKLVFSFLLLTTILLFALKLLIKRKLRINSNKIFTLYFLPSLIFSLVFLFAYSPFVVQTSEIFELANPANSMMRVFKDKLIPFVDFMSSHMFNEQWFGLIYFSIFGYNASLDFLAWEFFNTFIFYLVAFFFIRKIIKDSAYAFLFVLTFSFLSSVFYVNIFISVFAFYAILKLQKSQSVANYLLLFATVLILIVWRLDTGSAALFTTVFSLPIFFISEKTKLNLKNLLKASSLLLAILFILFSLVFILRSPTYILENIRTAFHYISANQAHGFISLAHSYPHQFFVYHIIFPFVGVLAVFFIVFNIRKLSSNKSESHKSYVLKSSLFFFICYLANAQRGLVRHSFMEFTEGFLVSTFFLASALLLTYLFYCRSTYRRFYVFYSSSFILFLFLKFFPLSGTEIRTEKALQNPGIRNMDLAFDNSVFNGRTIKNIDFENQCFTDLKFFMDANLNPNQSFIDFSNTPMLYYYCQREIPGYFNQNLQNTVDDFLQLQLIKSFDKEKFPLVVYSNYPPNWFDKTDGVPNPMRYYLIADFIFTNYEPLSVISNKSIWKLKTAEIESINAETDSIINNFHIFHYKHSAILLGHFLNSNSNSNFETIKISKTEDLKTNRNLFIDINNNDVKDKSLFLMLEISTDNENEESFIHLRSEDKYLGHFVFNLKKGIHKYAVRLSNNYLWHVYNTDQIIIDKNEGTEITEYQLIKDKRLEH